MRQLTNLVLALAALTTSTALAQHRGPPPESLQACSGLASGAACGFTVNGKNLTGACRAGPNGEALACAPAGGPGGRHGPPPAESVAACSGQSDGAACTFSVDGKTLSGTCGGPPDGSFRACRPEGGPGGGGHHGPPPEALAACASSSEGATCSVNFNGQTLSGTCRAGPHGEALACMPPHP